MKRDFDLIRSILIQVEAAPSGAPISRLTIESSITPATLIEHIQIMADEGLIEAQVLSARNCAFGIHKLTWKGHDFLDAARSDTIWKKAKDKLLEVGGSGSLEIVKAVLTQITKTQLGLT